MGKELKENWWGDIITVVEPSWLKKVQAMVQNYEFFRKLEEDIRGGRMVDKHYEEYHGVSYNKESVLPDLQSDLCGKVFYNHHSSPVRSYSGYHHTLQRMKHTLW